MMILCFYAFVSYNSHDPAILLLAWCIALIKTIVLNFGIKVDYSAQGFHLRSVERGDHPLAKFSLLNYINCTYIRMYITCIADIITI